MFSRGSIQLHQPITADEFENGITINGTAAEVKTEEAWCADKIGNFSPAEGRLSILFFAAKLINYIIVFHLSTMFEIKYSIYSILLGLFVWEYSENVAIYQKSVTNDIDSYWRFHLTWLIEFESIEFVCLWMCDKLTQFRTLESIRNDVVQRRFAPTIVRRTLSISDFCSNSHRIPTM